MTMTSAASGQVVSYTNQASFLANVQAGYYLENYEGLAQAAPRFRLH